MIDNCDALVGFPVENTRQVKLFQGELPTTIFFFLIILFHFFCNSKKYSLLIETKLKLK
jgi:hypothetical protein